MFKKIATTTALIAVITVLVLSAAGCSPALNSSLAQAGQTGLNAVSGAPANGAAVQDQGGRGRGSGGSGGSSAGSYGAGGNGAGGNGAGGNGAGGAGAAAGGLTNLPPASGELSADEAAALLFMREEEKLAHDVYVTLYAQWNLPVFQNISGSEQTHTDSVKALIERYGLADPASSSVGVFTDPTLQKLYTDLIAQGSQSVAEALKVGAAIEEIDILDLEKRIPQTDNADIQQVFNSLLRGSYNHLRAFTTNLQSQTGETYQPQYLSADAYQAILSGSTGGGMGGGMGGGSGRGNGGGGGGGGGRGKGGNGGARP